MTANERILELSIETFRRSSGRGMRPAGAPPSKSSTQTTACSTFRTASLLDTTHWTNSPGNYVRPIRILPIHRMDRPRPYTTGEFLLGVRARKASHPSTPGSMLSLFERARLLSFMSFSIRNCPLPSTTSRLHIRQQISRRFSLKSGSRKHAYLPHPERAIADRIRACGK